MIIAVTICCLLLLLTTGIAFPCEEIAILRMIPSMHNSTATRKYVNFCTRIFKSPAVGCMFTVTIDSGEKETRFMKNKIEYPESEIGDVKIVTDFLPPPSKLVLRDDNVKVTLSLTRRSINFFKAEAKKQRVPYQKMIRS
jgi:hypothetical protein